MAKLNYERPPGYHRRKKAHLRFKIGVLPLLLGFGNLSYLLITEQGINWNFIATLLFILLTLGAMGWIYHHYRLLPEGSRRSFKKMIETVDIIYMLSIIQLICLILYHLFD